MKKEKIKLEDVLAAIKPEHLHAETWTEWPLGKEVLEEREN